MMPDGWRLWLQFENALSEAGANLFPDEAEALEADAGRYLTLIKMIARRRE